MTLVLALMVLRWMPPLHPNRQSCEVSYVAAVMKILIKEQGGRSNFT